MQELKKMLALFGKQVPDSSLLSAIVVQQIKTYLQGDKFKFGLLGGDMSLCILLEEFQESIDPREYQNLMTELINRNIRHVNEADELSYGIYTGISGLYWTLQHLNKDESYTSYLEQLKPTLDWALDHFLDNGNYDLLYGANGIMISLVGTESAGDLINKYLRSLKRTAQYDEYGIFWSLTNSAVVNFGLAHGLAGIMQVLILYRLFNVSEVDIMLIDISASLINRIDVGGEIARVPCAIAEDKTIFFDDGIGWCFGRLSIGYSLLRFYQILKNEQTKVIADRIIKESLTIVPNFKDLKHRLCLCHGYASTAYMYREIYNINCDQVYLDKAVSICESIVIELFEDGHIVSELADRYSLLSGFPGIILTINHILTMRHSRWQEVLLLT